VKTYIVFCQHVSGIGTIWIDSVKALHIEEAKSKALVACADDWNCPVDCVRVLGVADDWNVRVLGVAEGFVEIIEWNDPE